MMFAEENEDWSVEVKKFEDSKSGVKGLVDAAITTIPRFFVHPSQTLLGPTSLSLSDGIPVVDLSGANSSRRSLVVDQLREASRTWGFFRIINHGIPSENLHRMISAIKSFHELPAQIKSQYYRRDMELGVAFVTNYFHLMTKPGCWRDTLKIKMGPTPPHLDSIPLICRAEVFEWDRWIGRLGELLMELLGEGLGLEAARLNELQCTEDRIFGGQYYPYCPQQDLTVGMQSHTDPGIMTMALQNQIGALQVKHGEYWVDVKPPVDGALHVHIGDILQVLSNDEYKSAEHRVLANRYDEPRVSLVTLLNSSKGRDSFHLEPLTELISIKRPARFRKFKMSEYLEEFYKKESDGRSVINLFRL